MVFGEICREKWHSHIIFPDTSTRSLPKTKWGDDILCDCAQNHWQSVDSLLRFVNFQIQSSTDARENWLFVIDCAPVHTAHARAASSTSTARSTLLHQSWDPLAHAAGKHFASTSLDTLTSGQLHHQHIASGQPRAFAS
eukprot:4891005-Amphidinium_carterae.1